MKYLLALIILMTTKSFIFALLAFFAVGIFERYQNLGSGALNPLATGKRRQVFLDTIFVLMGKIAKADGRVSQEEIQLAEQVITQLNLNTAHRRQAIELFKQGTKKDFDMDLAISKFMQTCGNTRSLKQTLLVYLISLAVVDSEFHKSEEALLKNIASQLNFSEAEFTQLLEMIKNQAQFSGGKMPTKNGLELAYKALGVKESASDQELKKTYRRLMSQHHPDKLMGQGLPEDMIKVATEKSKEIQKAYELIKNHRK